jgi:hypothetical protein
VADDVLAALPPPLVAAFYGRLADGVDARKGKLEISLAALLMRLWLRNRDKAAEQIIEAPSHLRGHEQTKGTLIYHRHVFLTEERARLGSREVWAGVVPRLQGKTPYQKWDLNRNLTMDYESLTEFPLRYQLTGSDADRDLLYSLHGFQLHSTVIVAGKSVPPQPGTRIGARVQIAFQSFETYAWDTYDWDYSEHLTVPNPDFKSSLPDAVAPTSKTVVVFHKNAKRIEDAGFAAPYRFKTKSWRITDADLVTTAVVDPARSV